MTKTTKPFTARAVRLALAASAVGQFLALPQVLAQQAAGGDEATELTPMFVTGSMIPQLDTILASPVEVVDASKIESIGASDSLDILRRTTPVFLGSSNYGQEVNNGGVGEAYIALRNLPTVVLLNGRRLGPSGFSNGAAVDVNTIPVAAIERIEVFKDGASAIYGADAIGGVVNIITKKNFQGTEVKGRWGMTTQEDDWYENSVSAVSGIGNDKGTITAGASYYYSTPLYASDREIASGGVYDLAAVGLNPPSYISPTYPGRIDNYVLAGSEFAQGHPNYNAAMTTIPDKYLQPGRKWTTGQLAAEGVLVPLGETPIGQQVGAPYSLLNTTQLGTHSIQSQDRRQFFGTWEQDLIGKNLQFFGDFLFSDSRSEGKLAPSPAPALGSYSITIPADNPYNPFGIALGTGAAASPRIRNRFMEIGNRVFRYDSTYYHFVGGLKGAIETGCEWIEDWQWQSAFNYNQSDQLNRNLNAGTTAALNQALTPDFSASSDGTLSQLTDASGPVPTYNYFALPGHNSTRTLNALRVSLFSKADSELYSFDASMTARALDLPAGKVGWAVGADYTHESLELSNDYLTQTGQGIGYNAGGNFPGGARSRRSVFIESAIPVLGKDFALPGAQAVEISAAGRIEELSPGGSAAVPRIGLKWKPLEENQLTLRGTYSEGFIAPTIYQVYGPPQENNPYVLLPDDIGVADKSAGQQSFTQLSSPDMPPSDSMSWTAGFALNPKFLEGLVLTVDYYSVEQTDYYTYDWQGYVNSLNTLGTASPYYNSYQDSGGNRITGPNQVTHATYGSGSIERTPGAQRTDGIDVSAQYHHKTDVAGNFTVYANANFVLNYEYQSAGQYYNYEGLWTGNIVGAQGAIPDYTFVTGLTWDYKDLMFNVNARYVPGMDDVGFMHPAVGNSAHGNTTSGAAWDVDSWFTIDMQLAYEIGRAHPTDKWYNGFRFAVGAQNVTDEDPPYVASSTEDYTDKSTYSILGRVLYFEVSKKF